MVIPSRPDESNAKHLSRQAILRYSAVVFRIFLRPEIITTNIRFPKHLEPVAPTSPWDNGSIRNSTSVFAKRKPLERFHHEPRVRNKQGWSQASSRHENRPVVPVRSRFEGRLERNSRPTDRNPASLARVPDRANVSDHAIRFEPSQYLALS